MKKIVLVDNLSHASSVGTTVIVDNKGMLQFSKNEGLVYSHVVEFMKNLPSQLVNGRSIKEWFRLRNHSLWWFAHGSLWRYIDANISFILNFENMLDTMCPDIVYLQGFYDKVDLIQQICRKKNVKLSIGMSSRNKIFLQSIKDKNIRRRGDIIMKQKNSKRIALAREAKHHSADNIKKSCVIYVAHETYRRRIYDFETGQVREGEFIAQKILQQVKRKGVDLLCIDVDHTFKGELSVLQRRLDDKDHYWIPLEILEHERYNDQELKRTINEIKHTLVSLFKNKDFQSLFTFQGISMWNPLRVRFDLLTETLPQRIRAIEAAKDILLKLEPRSIFLPYEKGPSAMTFIIAADELHIKTVGMQHGIIHESHPDYAITDLRIHEHSLGSPIPTVTVVFGEFYKELLTEKLAYPPNKVTVGGNPTYDGVNIHSNQLDKKVILDQLNLDPARKTVLVATSMGQKKHGQPDYDVVMIEALANSFAKNEGMQVVIKLHPKEDGAVYSKIIERRGAANFAILDHPIEELILACDVFLAVATTSILEAIVLERPVIIFQHSNRLSWYTSYLLENGAAIGAKYEELAEKVLEVLDNKVLTERLETKASEFAKYYFDLPSKEISQRIAEILIESNNNI